MKTKANQIVVRRDMTPDYEREAARDRERLSKGESAHTPGPWSYSGINTDMYIMARRGHEKIRVAEVICNDDLTPDETDANKALIAAAPETAAERDRLRADLNRTIASNNAEILGLQSQVHELLAACKALLVAGEKLVSYDDYVKQFGFSQEHAVDNALTAIQHAQEAQQ